MKIPKAFTNHPGVAKVVAGGDQGSDSKYWVFFKDGYGFYEHGQRDNYCWVCGGCAVDSVAEFKELNIEKKA
jgi:hypothetical protein